MIFNEYALQMLESHLNLPKEEIRLQSIADYDISNKLA